MKPFHSSYIWTLIHIFGLMQIIKSCAAGKPEKNEKDILKSYNIDHKSSEKIAQGANSIVLFAQRKADGKEVVLKCEDKGPGESSLQDEIDLYERLKNSKFYPNLAERHLLKMIDHGKGLVNSTMGNRKVLILERAGSTLVAEEAKNKKGNPAWRWPWPTVCKIMTDVLIAVETLHKEDIVHKDLLPGNIAFGLQPEPVKGAARNKDILYKTDLFVFDLGHSKDLRKPHDDDCRRDDMEELGSLLYHLLTAVDEFPKSWGYFEESKPVPNESVVKNRVTLLEGYLKGTSLENDQKRSAFREFHTQLANLYKSKEGENVIDHDKFKNIFKINSRTGKTDKQDDKKKKEANKNPPNSKAGKR